MRPKSYRVMQKRTIGGKVYAEPGDIVYDCMLTDYGLANDDTRMTGIDHTSVTKDPKGGYPSFTIPVKDLAMYLGDE